MKRPYQRESLAIRSCQKYNRAVLRAASWPYLIVQGEVRLLTRFFVSLEG
jgi:hypothetical protein